MKILQTSDVLVGRDFRELPELAEELRQARLDVLQTLVALAEKERVDALVLVGNTLADNRIAHRTLLDVARLLGASPVPVLLVPGACDPLTPDSPYELRADVFSEPVRIQREPWAVLTRGAASGPSLRVGDHLALPGKPPEPVDFDPEAGFAQIVTPSEVHAVRVARFIWEDTSDLEHPGGPNVILRLKLSGRYREDELPALEQALVRLRGRVRHLEVVNMTGVLEGVDYRHPLLASMASELALRAGVVTPDLSELPDEPEVAREALLLLRELVSRSGQADLT